MLPGLRNGVPWPTQNPEKRSLDPLPEGFRKQAPASEGPNHENAYSYTLWRGPGYPRRAPKRRSKSILKWPPGRKTASAEMLKKTAPKKPPSSAARAPLEAPKRGRHCFRSQFNGWPKTGSRCSCAPTPQKALSRVVFGDVFCMF